MNTYEIAIILSALSDKIDNESVQKIRNFIIGGGGSIKKEDIWEKRKLAYQIEKNVYGNYVFLNTEMPSESMEELQKQFKLNSEILRFLILDKTGIREEAPRRHRLSPKPTAAAPVLLQTDDRGEKVKIEELDKKLEEILKE